MLKQGMGRENLQELVKRQAETIRSLEARIIELEAIIAGLQKDSRNSSKPPSSDIVKPKPAAQKTNNSNKRKIGGQKGHKKYERKPYPPEQVDQFVEVTLDVCPECGGVLHECEEIVVKQQIDVVEKPFVVTEYHCHTYTCSECQGKHTAAAPKKADSGLFSIGLIALAAYLKGRCHVSFNLSSGSVFP
jgi:transposase